jgi:ATP synthase protein I
VRTVDPVRHPEEASRRIPGALQPSHGSQGLWSGVTSAWATMSYLVSGVVVWGGVGYGLDRLLGTSPVLMIIGVLVGNFAGVYLIYLRWPMRWPEEDPS